MTMDEKVKELKSAAEALSENQEACSQAYDNQAPVDLCKQVAVKQYEEVVAEILSSK